ncbi:MAG TPA: cytochrome P460 family protein [Polyangiaceae bacterium]|nr:cytochrome P460 family protein [Polyangiaceae bacterium]
MRFAVAVVVGVLAACSASDPPAQEDSPLFPADYADSYVEVRGCRRSADHELEFIRVLADPDALGPYTERTSAVPDGAVVLKEQYDPSDDTCSGPVTQWTVMLKNQSASERLGWDWQRVSANREVVEVNTPRCIGCHQGCTGAPGVGYDYTCTEP